MIIDIHCHTSDKKLYGLHTEDASIFKINDLSSDIDKICLLATCFPYKKSGVSAEQLLYRLGFYDKFYVFDTADLSAKNRIFNNELYRIDSNLKDGLVKGAKLYPGYQKFNYYDFKLFKFCETCGFYNAPIMIHTGELHHCCPKEERERGINLRCSRERCAIDENSGMSNPLSMVYLFQEFPKQKFILSHMGNPYFDELYYVLDNYPNTYTDISGQFISGKEDTKEYKQFIVDKINGFDPERLLFGSDFPIQSFKDSIELIERSKFTSEEKDKIYYNNAQQLLNI